MARRAGVEQTLAAGTGALLFGALLGVFGHAGGAFAPLALVAIGAGAALKWRYWRAIDADPGQYTAEMATGLKTGGGVRPLDPPHTRPNFVMREMGYNVARVHAAKLRRSVMMALFAVPAALTVCSILTGWTAALFALAMVTAAFGVFIERWLFFAEAEHVSQLYYGKARA